MPKLLYARPSDNLAEEIKIRKLANSRHAPGDWINRARMIVRSWEGLRTMQIASGLRCHPQTVRERIHPFNAEGFDGIGDRLGAGHNRRNLGSRKPSAHRSSRWLPPTHPTGWPAQPVASWRPGIRRRKPIGRCTLSPPPPEIVG
jgi:hypothetical protein